MYCVRVMNSYCETPVREWKGFTIGKTVSDGVVRYVVRRGLKTFAVVRTEFAAIIAADGGLFDAP